MENKDMKMDSKTCGCGHHRTFPILVIVLGVVFLLAALNILTMAFVNIIWPIIIIIAGFMKLGGNKCSCCAK